MAANRGGHPSHQIRIIVRAYCVSQMSNEVHPGCDCISIAMMILKGGEQSSSKEAGMRPGLMERFHVASGVRSQHVHNVASYAH